jgi:hypothetical protein
MADFAGLQQKFDGDPELCKRFLSDPVGVLAENNITLSPQQAFRLQQDVEEFTRPINATIDLHISVTAPRISISGPSPVSISVSGGINIF